MDFGSNTYHIYFNHFTGSSWCYQFQEVSRARNDCIADSPAVFPLTLTSWPSWLIESEVALADRDNVRILSNAPLSQEISAEAAQILEKSMPFSDESHWKVVLGLPLGPRRNWNLDHMTTEYWTCMKSFHFKREVVYSRLGHLAHNLYKMWSYTFTASPSITSFCFLVNLV